MGTVLFGSSGAGIPGALSLLRHTTSAVATTAEAILRIDTVDAHRGRSCPSSPRQAAPVGCHVETVRNVGYRFTQTRKAIQ